MKCTKCGAQLTPNAKFCTSCGNTLRNPTKKYNGYKGTSGTGGGGNNNLMYVLIVVLTVIIAVLATVLIMNSRNKDDDIISKGRGKITQTEIPKETDTPEPEEEKEPEQKVVIVEREVEPAYSKNNDVPTSVAYVVKCKEWITLRSKPSTSASEITKIPLGAAVGYITDASNGFYKVNYNGDTGYALAEYISFQKPSSSSSSSASEDTVKATCYVANCKEWITLRTSPSTSASEITKIPLGQSMGYIGSASNGFDKVSYNGNTGYVLSQYVSFDKPSSSSSSSSGGGSMTVVNCKEWVTLRSSASTSASSLEHVPLGASVEYVGAADNGFTKVKYNGKTGYILSQYLN